ncbi:hypothetical protein Vqi01_59500 [Micromonospora qiuiae]|uniref:Uncharacterized protein n=1 Tax=Micromonospora qiuiae TaxID=502268 RepID=A0ABQ4JJK7_9ACTN|nr:hypothetical protein [Micromonospora qiuiae]GIJ30788.1 hypothetical protein Vqi01_59500 [Micromonospora qiuiae]
MANTEDLPPSVASIAEYLAMMARGYDNHLKWNEQAKFKADLMNARDRWRGVAPEAFATKLRREGMREEDILELVDWLKRAQAGRRLIPQRTYRSHTFSPPPEAQSSGLGQHSRVW